MKLILWSTIVCCLTLLSCESRIRYQKTFTRIFLMDSEGQISCVEIRGDSLGKLSYQLASLDSYYPLRKKTKMWLNHESGERSSYISRVMLPSWNDTLVFAKVAEEMKKSNFEMGANPSLMVYGDKEFLTYFNMNTGDALVKHVRYTYHKGAASGMVFTTIRPAHLFKDDEIAVNAFSERIKKEYKLKKSDFILSGKFDIQWRDSAFVLVEYNFSDAPAVVNEYMSDKITYGIRTASKREDSLIVKGLYDGQLAIPVVFDRIVAVDGYCGEN